MLIRSLDFHGQMGRRSYFLSFIARILIIVLILLAGNIIVYGFEYLTTGQINGMTFDDWSQFDGDLEPSRLEQMITAILGLIAISPIEIRRANDLSINWKWIVPTFLSHFVVFAPSTDLFFVNGLIVLLNVYTFVIALILLFKPGQKYKDWVRSGKP